MPETDRIQEAISAPGATADQVVRPRKGKLTFQIEGTFVGTLQLRRQTRSGSPTVLATYTEADVPVDVDVSVASEDMLHDVNATALSSGTANVYLGGE